MKKLYLLLAAVVLFAIDGCTPIRPSAEDVHVYTFEPPSGISRDDSSRLIEKFLGARDVGDLYRSDDNSVYYVSKQDVSETFEHDLTTGNFTFNKSMRKHTGDFVPQLPDPQQSIALAQEFLAKNDIAPRNPAQLKMVHLGGLRSSSVVDGKRAGPVVDQLVTVNFGRIVDGIPVIGPGSKIVVHIGDKGEIMGAIRRWRELNYATRTTARTEETFSLQEAEEMARRQIVAEFGEDTSYRVLAAGKRYYDNNGKVLQPVYAFEVTITLKDERIRPFDYLCVIPMLRNSPEPLNLTAVDPTAKRLIGTPRRGEQVPMERTRSD
jgi:hypothetical protein